MKILLISFFLLIKLNADSYYEVSGTCIQDNYYISSSKLCYKENNNTAYSCDTTIFNPDNLHSNYKYNSSSNTCDYVLKYGLTQNQYDVISALMGLLLGLIIVFSVFKIYLRKAV